LGTFWLLLQMNRTAVWSRVRLQPNPNYERGNYFTFEFLTVVKKPVGFGVLTAVSTKMAVFWVVAPCSLVEVYQRFRGPCCLHHQGDVSVGIVRCIAMWT
jgi:hypothetical protein